MYVTSPLYVTLPHDPSTRLLCSLIQFAELSQLNISLRFCQKHNFFEAPKICSVSTWRITWLFPFMQSISLNQPSVFVSRLTVFTMLKAPHSTGQPGRLEEKKQKTFKTTKQSKWPGLVLASAFVGALFPSVKNELNQIVSIDNSGICNALLLSPEHLFTKPLKQFKEFQPINSNSCASTVDLSFAHLFAPLFQLRLLPKSYSNSF